MTMLTRSLCSRSLCTTVMFNVQATRQGRLDQAPDTLTIQNVQPEDTMVVGCKGKALSTNDFIYQEGRLIYERWKKPLTKTDNDYIFTQEELHGTPSYGLPICLCSSIVLFQRMSDILKSVFHSLDS